ncbi:uncharacterized protein [Nicotiana tomentosiformis]|uniref:uncharacterized protein n=1 Tax=Nicotiana tomentosiformis TaxID=4098 RepID=UPI00051B5800|nr:uncharacterized protein LOC104099447 [Nicotiana tomentosiformis]
MDIKAEKRRVEEDLETISLSDLQMKDGNESPKNSSSPQDFFEFFTESDSENYTFSEIIFCGKKISHENNDKRQLEEQLNETYLSPLFRSNSFHRPVTTAMNQKRANSARFYSSQNVQKVNITALTSMSEKSRRRMFMFGPVKFNPEMELSAIKKRQSRRCVPPPVIPASNGGETAALVKSSQKKNKSGPTKKIEGLRSRPHLANVLAKSLRCFSLRKHCMALP